MDRRMDQFEEIKGKVCEDFTAKLNFIHSGDKIEMTQKTTKEVEDRQTSELHEDEDEEESEGDDDDFSFVFNRDVSADTVIHDGQFRPVFPLFDRDLLLDYDSESSEDHLQHRPPVKVFTESSHQSSSSSESDEIDGVAAGTYCVWTKKGKDKKSNSTGFSKLWRLGDHLVNRSNSDGRDALVFLNKSTACTKKEKVIEKKVESATEKRTASQSSSEKKTISSGEIKDNSTTGTGGKVKVKKTGKGKTATLSAHEIYMRNKGTHEDRRRSYLPYRPELMGFFTNVHGGLSRNVHPF